MASLTTCIHIWKCEWPGYHILHRNPFYKCDKKNVGIARSKMRIIYRMIPISKCVSDSLILAANFKMGIPVYSIPISKMVNFVHPRIGHVQLNSVCPDSGYELCYWDLPSQYTLYEVQSHDKMSYSCLVSNMICKKEIVASSLINYTY